jgi:signal transduction histidine kinase
MCDLIDSTISEVRNIATRLRPAVLDDLGLIDALEWHAADFEKRTGIPCVFRHNQVPPVSEPISVAVYRVAQEALTNAARHSGAARVEISLRAREGRLRLAVADNGRGFNPDSPPDKGQLGVAGMHERAGLAGGRLEIRSRPGGGAEVRLDLPLGGPEGE